LDDVLVCCRVKREMRSGVCLYICVGNAGQCKVEKPRFFGRIRIFIEMPPEFGDAPVSICPSEDSG
jgi:hypothetical protein